MNRDGFGGLIIPSRPEGNADVKWLSESNADWVVFPAEGPPTLIFRGGEDSREVQAKSPVTFDLRVSRFNRSQLIIDRLKELGLERSRIGVGNLSGQMRNDEGGVSFVTSIIQCASARTCRRSGSLPLATASRPSMRSSTMRNPV